MMHPARLRSIPGSNRVDAVIDAVYIDGEEPVPGLLADLIDKTVVGDGGVVDQHGPPARSPGVPRSRLPGQPRRRGRPQRRSPGPELLPAPGCGGRKKPDPMALGGEIPDGFCADSPAAACD